MTIQYSKEAFVIEDNKVILYAYNEPVWKLKHYQITSLGGIYKVSNLDIYLVEIGFENQYSYFSAYTSIDSALEAREKMSEITKINNNQLR